MFVKIILIIVLLVLVLLLCYRSTKMAGGNLRKLISVIGADGKPRAITVFKTTVVEFKPIPFKGVVDHLAKTSAAIAEAMAKISAYIAKVSANPMEILFNVLKHPNSYVILFKTQIRNIKFLIDGIFKRKFNRDIFKNFTSILVLCYRVEIYNPVVKTLLRVMQSASVQHLIDEGQKGLQFIEDTIQDVIQLCLHFLQPSEIGRILDDVMVNSESFADVKTIFNMMFTKVMAVINKAMENVRSMVKTLEFSDLANTVIRGTIVVDDDFDVDMGPEILVERISAPVIKKITDTVNISLEGIKLNHDNKDDGQFIDSLNVPET